MKQFAMFRLGWWFWCALVALGLAQPGAAQAANYTFPGSLPAGCSGSGTAYTCGALTLASGDTVAVTNASTTITFTSLSTNNAQINAAGTANLTLTVSGTLTVASGAVIKANVTAGSVSSAGAVTYVGSLTTTGSGAITLGAGTTVSGALTTVTGAVTLNTGTSLNYTTVGSINAGGTVIINAYNRVNGPVVGSLLSAAGNNTINGSITSTSTYVSLGGNATVNGSIYAQTYVDTGGNSNISGSITSATSYIDTGAATTVGGSLSALGTYVDIHGSASIGGSVYANSYVSMTTNSTVGGGVTANSTIAMGSGSTASKCVRSKNASTITVPLVGALGGACCGSGSTCSNTCVSGALKPPACAWPQSGLVAEYRFEESSYSGAEAEVLDSSGNKRHGKMLGAVTSTASGKICRGMQVPNNTTSAVAAFDSGIDVNAVGNSGTVAFWYKSVTSGTEHRMLFDASAVASGSFYLYRDDQGSGVDLNFQLTDGGATARNVDKLNAMSDNTWAHVSITWKVVTGTSATRLRLYVNGVQQDEQTYTVASGAINSAIGTLFFGDNRSATSAELNSANGTIDQVKLYDAELTASEISTLASETPACAPAPAVPHHIEITSSSASGLTCAPNTFTIKACANDTCSIPYAAGLTGNLVLTGAGGSTTPFTIGAGNSTAAVSKQITKVGTVTASISSPSPAPSNNPTTFCGMGSTATSGGSCAYSTAISALTITNLPNHEANVQQAGVTLKAVKSNADNTACVPVFTGAKSISFQCAYRNPTSGSRTVVVGGSASVTCGSNTDGAAQTRTLTFDGTGTATTTVQYADVGLVRLTASYAGTADVDSDVSGSAEFIAAPASFAVTPPAGPIKAGDNFSTSITAQVSGGGAALNFGKESSPESVTMNWARFSPTGTGSSAGVFSGGTLGGFNNGLAVVANMSWTEVGTGTLSAELTSSSYLGSGLNATGSTAAGGVGAFVPYHYQVDVNNGCGTQFTYSGQPFGVVVTAFNKTGGITVNHDGSGTLSAITASDVTLSAASNGSTGSLTNATVAKGSFSLGRATLAAAPSAPIFTFSTKPHLPTLVTIRATDANTTSSSGYTEGAVSLRSGRIKVSNKFGSASTALSVPVQTHYWKGVSSGSGAATWVVNAQDSCTVVPATAVVLGGYLDSKGESTSAWPATASAVSLTSGNGVLTLTKPGSITGSVDFAVALGSASTDQSCLNPARSISSTNAGAGMAWLRSQYGSTFGCAGNVSHDRDPSARATFGVFAPETQKAVHVRDIF